MTRVAEKDLHHVVYNVLESDRASFFKDLGDMLQRYTASFVKDVCDMLQKYATVHDSLWLRRPFILPEIKKKREELACFKLVNENKATTALAIRFSDMSLVAFMNHNGDWYELSGPRMLPAEHGQSKLVCRPASYASLLGMPLHGLMRRLDLGMETVAMAEAVSMLSHFVPSEDGHMDKGTIRALASLLPMDLHHVVYNVLESDRASFFKDLGDMLQRYTASFVKDVCDMLQKYATVHDSLWLRRPFILPEIKKKREELACFKLVNENKATTALAIRFSDMSLVAFMNHNGDWYELRGPRMLPAENEQSKLICRPASYASLLFSGMPVHGLMRRLDLGMETVAMAEAVSMLSHFVPSEDGHMDKGTIRALASLLPMDLHHVVYNVLESDRASFFKDLGDMLQRYTASFVKDVCDMLQKYATVHDSLWLRRPFILPVNKKKREELACFKLVNENKATTALAIRFSDMSLVAFMNHNGDWYELSGPRMLPAEHGQSKLVCRPASYASLLFSGMPVHGLMRRLDLGMETVAMAEAVSMLSHFVPSEDGHMDKGTIRALASLLPMV
ncbi:hypothetical protein E2562_003067 [Oryza meyeriana var. granulata]|uniref:Uncharacterized protein n=1 Tax=Oryza meyeriana var. granulata TaxID=110450 RepID=A0A6G1E9K4_9ORYZ|nr:hypothetical protein E2562_003067 [Oryza meyeriana var. granulata]